MTGVAKGIAHVSFSGGGIFVPARNPYDRQMLVEHITDRVRAKGQVQVLIDDERWMVHLQRGPAAECCTRCGYRLDSACYSTTTVDEQACCVKCAFGGYAPTARPYHQPQRRAAS